MIDQLLLHTTTHHQIGDAVDQQQLYQYMPPLYPYLSELVEFGADFVDEAMLPVDRFSMEWDPSLVPQIGNYIDRHHVPPLSVYPSTDSQ